MAKKSSAKKATAAHPPASGSAAAAASVPPAPAPATPTLQSFASATVKRSTLHEYPGNPRVIDAAAQRRLRRVIEAQGLVEPLVVSRSTMYVLGGHQRMACMDDLLGYPGVDYDVPVALVDCESTEHEKEILLMLNSSGIQGQWEADALSAFIEENPELNVEKAGFTKKDMQGLSLSPEAMATIFGESSDIAQQVAAEAPILDQMEEIRQDGRAAEVARKKAEAERKERIEKLKANRKESIESRSDESDVGYYITLVGESCKEVALTLHHLGFDPVDTSIPLTEFLSRAGVDLGYLDEFERQEKQKDKERQS